MLAIYRRTASVASKSVPPGLRCRLQLRAFSIASIRWSENAGNSSKPPKRDLPPNGILPEQDSEVCKASSGKTDTSASVDLNESDKPIKKYPTTRSTDAERQISQAAKSTLNDTSIEEAYKRVANSGVAARVGGVARAKAETQLAATSSRGANNGSGRGDAADQHGTAAPISKNDRILPIQLQFRPVFPGMASHFTSKNPKLINAVAKLQETRAWNHRVIAVMSKTRVPTTQLVTNLDDVHEIACCCRLQTTLMTHNADNQLMLYGTLFPLFRVRVGELVENVKGANNILRKNFDEKASVVDVPKESPLDGINVQWMKGVTALPNEPYAVNDEEIQQLCRKIIDSLNQMSNLSSSVKTEIEKFSQLVPTAPGSDFTQPDFLADFTASLIPKNDRLQEILEITDVKERLRVVADLVSKEVTYMRVQEGIYKYGHDQTQQRNRETILHEYLKYIKKELGMEGDDKTKLADRFQERADSSDMPSEVRQVFDEEINKFRGLEPNAGEYNTVRTYLDWLTQVPWGKTSADRFVIRSAREILDKSHHGLKDVKDRILEFLAVGKLSGSVDGKIICLAGPPGVGKTSIAKAIATSLGRKFDRFSVGGLYDVCEIKGHRRTYVASLPGRVVQALKKCQTMNPVILIDEIDKLSRGGSHGDPAAALLEVLDPEQNKNFQDTYLEVPVDLSRVLFICTANNIEGIPAPLIDRMEIIHISGYLPEEKVAIARDYLSPKARQTSGLENAEVEITRDAIRKLINQYTRESGVRGLNKTIEKIYRKVAFQLVEQAEKDSDDKGNATVTKHEEKTKEASPAVIQEDAGSAQKADETVSKPEQTAEQVSEDMVRSFKLQIGPTDLVSYIGVPVHSSDRLFESFPIGVSMGLGWTPGGGVPLFIESVIQEPLSPKGTPRFTRTGQLGEVMNESTSIAYSFARMFMSKNFPRNHFFDHAVIHTHFPEGAIKKDGPSAGIAMAASLLSLAMNLPVNKNVAMTGELTLTGRVLQIGGLREKAVAAKTFKAKTIIFPEDNRAEWEDLPAVVKEGLDPRPVRDFQSVFDVVFGAVNPAQVNAAWPELTVSETSKESEPRKQQLAAL